VIEVSCEECEKIQELNRIGKELAFFRVGNGNVLVGACDKHFHMIRNAVMGSDESNRPVIRMIDEGKPDDPGWDDEGKPDAPG
jgi:hypothetical protein